jgi:hypothetical protein
MIAFALRRESGTRAEANKTPARPFFLGRSVLVEPHWRRHDEIGGVDADLVGLKR